MEQIEDLKPIEKKRVFDLVKEAGLDVTDWANYSRGPRWAAANPKYCYEWAFVQAGRVVIVNLWYAQLAERRGIVSWSSNVRGWIRRHSVPGANEAVWRKRAEAFDVALQEAAHGGLPIRAIINDGRMRKPTEVNAKASSVQRRLLDPLPWAITSYNKQTGQCTLTRGVITKGSVDQFDLAPGADEVAERISVQSTVFVRNPLLRAEALRRANGRCEFCLRPGFTMADGRVFLETHHVVPFFEGGTDGADNVVAICANHHREAHYGSQAKVIRETLLKRLAGNSRAV